MAAYLTLLVILLVWAFLVLRDEPQLRPYGIIYGVNALVALATESLFAIVLDTYTFGGYINYFLVTLGIEPLLGVIYAHYAGHRPIHRAIAGGIILGGPVEVIFLKEGVYAYERGWHPVLTMVAFAGYFLWTWWLRTLFVERNNHMIP